MTGKLTYGWADGRDYDEGIQVHTGDSIRIPVTDADHWFMPVIQYKDGKASIIFPGFGQKKWTS